MLADKRKGHEDKSRLSDLPKVFLAESEAGSPMKFIIARISDGADEMMVMRAESMVSSSTAKSGVRHVDIMKKLKSILKVDLGIDADVDVRGAAWLLVERSTKSIWLWGSSSDYGYPDYNEAGDLLAEAYPDYRIIIVDKDTLKGRPRLKRIFSEIERDSRSGEYPAKRMETARLLLEQKPN